MNSLVMHSLKTSGKLEIIYLDSSNQFSQRTIRPIRIKGGKLVAYCFSRRQIRTFHMENIMSALPFQTRNRVS